MNQSIKKNIITYDIISKTFQALIILLILTILSFVFKEHLKPYNRYLKIGFIVVIVYQLYKCFITPFISIKVFKYSIDDKKIEYNQGVFTTTKTIIPMRRVQQVTTQTNPLLDKLGLVKVNILTTTNNHYLRSISIYEGDEIVKLITEKLYEQSIDISTTNGGDKDDKK